MVTASFINRLSNAVDLIEKRTQPKAWKTVTVRRDWREHGDVAIDRHMAAHPEDRHADIVIFHFCDIKTANESRVGAQPATPARKEP